MIKRNHLQETYQNFQQKVSFQSQIKTNNALILGTKKDNTPVYTPLPKFLEYLNTHVQIIGPTGCGKSKLMEYLFRLLVTKLSGASFVLIDPKGDLYRTVLRFCLANNLTDRLVLFDPGQRDYIIGYNPMSNQRQSVVDQTLTVVEAIRACWGQETFNETPQLQRWLLNGIYTLVHSQATFIDAVGLFSISDNWKRELFVSKLQVAEEIEQVIKEEWNNFAKLSLARRKDDINSSYARLRSFCTHPAIISILTQKHRSLDLYKVIRQNKILLVNLERYKPLRPDLIYLLGTLLVNDLVATVFSQKEQERKPVYLFLDEAHHFMTRDLIPILEEGRAFKLFLILAHQSLGQLLRKDPDVYDTVMTNARTKILFGGLTNHDLEILAPELFTTVLDTYKIKDEIKTPVFEPIEERRQSYGFSQNISDTKGESKGFHAGLNFGSNFSQNQSVIKARSKTKGKVDGASKGEGSGIGDASVISSGSGFSQPLDDMMGGVLLTSTHSGSTGSSFASSSSGTSHADIESETNGMADQKGTSEGLSAGISMGFSYQKNKSKALGKGFSITDSPFHAYKKYEIVSQRKFQEIEEQLFEKLQLLKGQKKREFTIKFPEREAIQLITPWVESTKEENVLTQADIEKSKEKIFIETGFYSTPLEINEERQRQLETWQKEHQKLLSEKEYTLTPPEPTTFRHKKKPKTS